MENVIRDNYVCDNVSFCKKPGFRIFSKIKEEIYSFLSGFFFSYFNGYETVTDWTINKNYSKNSAKKTEINSGVNNTSNERQVGSEAEKE